MDRTTLRSYVYQDLAEAQIGNDRVQPADINDALNRVYQEIAANTLCLTREASVNSVTGQATYAMPADMFLIRAVRYGALTTPLTATTLPYLTMRVPGWRDTAAAAEPTYYYVFDARNFGLYPKPNANGTAIKVEGHILPVASPTTGQVGILAQDSDAPALPPNYHIALVHGAVFLLCTRYLADGELAVQKAQVAKAEYDRMVAELANYQNIGVHLAVR